MSVERRPTIYGTFGDNSVMCRSAPLIYGVKDIANQDGALAISGDQQHVYVNVSVPEQQQKLVCVPNSLLFPILLQKDVGQQWFVHPNLLQFMQIASSKNLTDQESLFPVVELAPQSTYHVSASVSVDIGMWSDNAQQDPHYVVLDLTTNEGESMLSATTVVWRPDSGPPTRSVQLSGRVRNGGSSPLELQLQLATTAVMFGIVPRFFVMTQMFNDF